MITYTASELLSSESINTSKASSPIITGFSSLDDDAGGLAQGLVLLGGRPSPCHDGLAKYLALRASKDGNRKVVWFSTAFSARFLLNQFVRQGCYHQDLIENENLTIVDTPSLTMGMIEDELDGLIPNELSEQGLVIIDDLSKLIFSLRQENYSNTTVAENLRELGLARNLTVLLNCMLRKKLEKRKCKYPRLSDFKEYDHFVVEADQVLVTFYPHTYRPEQESKDYWELNLFKNRNGPCVSQYSTVPISALF